MQINNVASTVPTQVKQLFYSRIPWGSEYYIYCSSSGNVGGYVEYTMLLREIGETTFDVYTVSRSSSSSAYVLQNVAEDQAYSDITMLYPYYAYSSEGRQGITEQIPAGDNLLIFCVIICSLLLVLKTVFGGVRLWRSRKSFQAY